jgi:hypothetical protein
MLLERSTRLLSRHLPKVISPKTHAIIDYAVVATGFFAVARAAWNSNKKAALTSLACGIAEVTNILLTDMPGGVFKVIDFPTHGRVDAGFSSVAMALPNLMDFTGEWPAWFFRAHGMAIAAVTGMTDFEAIERPASRYRRAA